MEYVNTASLSYEISQRFGTYVEVAMRFGNESPFGGIVVIGGGLLFTPSKDLQLDGGINVGVTRAADRSNPFLGISKRF